MGSLDLDLLDHHRRRPPVWQLLAFLSIFVMMTVLSKRYVAPLIKALKPRRHTRTNSRALSVTSEKRGKEVPSEADVVVIGGGSLGCQTLYHLAKLGVTNTVLLEKEQLTAGTTWHTAGLFWSLRPNDTEIELLTHTRKVITGLEEETGVDPGWINNGGLFIANNKERMEEYRRLYTMGKALGIESHLLSPEETKRLYPLMNVDDIYGTRYSPLVGFHLFLNFIQKEKLIKQIS